MAEVCGGRSCLVHGDQEAEQGDWQRGGAEGPDRPPGHTSVTHPDTPRSVLYLPILGTNPKTNQTDTSS